MAHSYNYCVLRFMPDAVRGEIVNIGLVIFNGKKVDVRLAKQLAKAQALVPNMDVTGLGELAGDIEDLCENLSPDDAVQMLSGYSPFTCSKLGVFRIETAGEYEAKVTQIMRWLVLPPRRPNMNEGRTRLHAEVRRIFKKHGLLAAEPEEIMQHKVVQGYELPGEEDLTTDFAIRNGLWRFTQVVDYRTTLKGAHAKIKEVSLKAVAIHQAPDALEVAKSEVKGYALVWVPDEFESVAKAHLKVMSDFTEQIFHYDRPDHRQKYWDLVGKWLKSDSPIQ